MKICGSNIPHTQLLHAIFANDPEDLGSIPGCIIPKTLKMVLDTSLVNTQQYKVRIDDKVEQSRERNSALPYTSVLYLLKREPSGHPRLRSPTLFTYINILGSNFPPPTFSLLLFVDFHIRLPTIRKFLFGYFVS